MHPRGWREGAALSFYFVLAAVLVLGAFAGYIVYTLPKTTTPSRVAAQGDTVQVDYVGKFEDGTVFDTSIKSVAIDNVTYPKALSFQPRGTYTPLSFTIGNKQVVPGFEQGVMGLRVGNTKTIVVPPDQGYGPENSSLVQVRTLVETLRQWEKIPTRTFEANFSMTPPTAPAQNYTTEPGWGWNVTVFPEDKTSATVTIIRRPDNGTLIHPYGAWDARIIDVDSSRNEIKVQHLLTPANAGRIQAREGTRNFILTKVDERTFTLDGNREVVGKTLIFEVTLVSVNSSGVTPTVPSG